MEITYDFGTFFHNVRIARGFPLMNFCRENNLSVVLVTSIERGNAIPQKEEVSNYVKALKLRRGTKDYKKFIELYETIPEKEKEPKNPFFDIPKEKLDQILKLIS